MESLSVGSDEVELRLDTLLRAHFPEHSRTYFQHLIAEGLVLVNGTIAKKSQKLELGDELEVAFALTPEIELTPEPIPLDILFEDDDLIAINKPAGLTVHPGAGHPNGTFVNALLYHCKTLPVNDLRPGIVHRLDRLTSGVLLAAKTSRAHMRLVELFATRQMEKEYLAICLNRPTTSLIDAPIGRHPTDRKRFAINPGGKEAITHLSLLAHHGDLSLVRLTPKTGRTHQLRVHLASINCPIVGDPVYGSPSANKRYNTLRQLLHAAKLSFIHPFTGQPLSLTAPLPTEMTRFKELFS